MKLEEMRKIAEQRTKGNSPEFLHTLFSNEFLFYEMAANNFDKLLDVAEAAKECVNSWNYLDDYENCLTTERKYKLRDTLEALEK